MAILENPVEPVINIEQAKLAVKIVKSSCQYATELFSGELMAKSNSGKLYEAIVEKIRAADGKPIAKTALRKGSSTINNAKVFEIDNTLDDLVRDELIRPVKFKTPKAKRPTTGYFWCGPDDF